MSIVHLHRKIKGENKINTDNLQTGNIFSYRTGRENLENLLKN